jgi:hypothetical protein
MVLGVVDQEQDEAGRKEVRIDFVVSDTAERRKF